MEKNSAKPLDLATLRGVFEQAKVNGMRKVPVAPETMLALIDLASGGPGESALAQQAEKVGCGSCKGAAGGCADCSGTGYHWEPIEAESAEDAALEKAAKALDAKAAKWEKEAQRHLPHWNSECAKRDIKRRDVCIEHAAIVRSFKRSAKAMATSSGSLQVALSAAAEA